MTLKNTKKNLQARKAGRPRGPRPWLKALAEASGYSAHYLSRAINGHVQGPVLEVVSEARSKGLIPARRTA